MFDVHSGHVSKGWGPFLRSVTLIINSDHYPGMEFFPPPLFSSLAEMDIILQCSQSTHQMPSTPLDKVLCFFFFFLICFLAERGQLVKKEFASLSCNGTIWKYVPPNIKSFVPQGLWVFSSGCCSLLQKAPWGELSPFFPLSFLWFPGGVRWGKACNIMKPFYEFDCLGAPHFHARTLLASKNVFIKTSSIMFLTAYQWLLLQASKCLDTVSHAGVCFSQSQDCYLWPWFLMDSWKVIDQIAVQLFFLKGGRFFSSLLSRLKPDVHPLT